MSGVLQKKLSKILLCSAAILHLHPTSWLKDLSTVSTNLVVSYFVEDLPLAASETEECHKKSQTCVHKVYCACKDRPCERTEKLFSFFVTFLIFVNSIISGLLICKGSQPQMLNSFMQISVFGTPPQVFASETAL